MQKNILIIDDSALMRRLFSDIISTDNRFVIKDYACDGLEGLNLIVNNKGAYDAILLDVNMPKMNGLEVLEKLQKYNIKCKVIMVSTLVKDGAKETIAALEKGAFDFVLKPFSAKPEVRESFKKKIIRTLELATGLENEGTENKTKVYKSNNVHQKVGSDAKKIVAIASSSGGPKSLKEVIPFIDKNINAPVLLVQHMPAGFTASLAQRFDEISEIKVKEAQEGDVLQKGVVYIAPGGKHMKVVTRRDGSHVIELTDEPNREGVKPCANYMYESLIDSDYDEITCVVLTGMGSDGTVGIKNLCGKKNVYVIAQDSATSVVYGMPKAIANTGLTDEILPLQEIASAISKNVGVLNNGR